MPVCIGKPKLDSRTGGIKRLLALGVSKRSNARDNRSRTSNPQSLRNVKRLIKD